MARSGEEGLDQRLDRWVEAGRQLVDGVSGARPGSRAGARGGARRSGSRLNPGELGRWVENKLEWLLDEDTGDDWREPWQQQQETPRARRRRPLEAVSRRGNRVAASGLSAATPGDTPPGTPAVAAKVAASAAPAAADAAAAEGWPEDDVFSVPRWQRQPTRPLEPRSAEPSRPRLPAERPLPRSTRRR